MLERDPSQTQVPGSTPGDADDPSAVLGSRPAQNARQVASTSEVDTEWRGADEAADFLGLDQELRALDAPFAPAIPGAPNSEPSAVPAARASAVSEPIPGAPPVDSLGALLSTIEGEAAVDPAENPLAPDLATPDPFAFEETAPAEEAPKQRGATWYAVRALAASVLVGLSWYAYDTYLKPQPEVPLATAAKPPVSRTTPVTKPADATAPAPASDPLASSTSDDLDADAPQSTRVEDLTAAVGASEGGETIESPLMPSSEFEQFMRESTRSVWHGRDALAQYAGGSTPFDPLHQMESVSAMRGAIAAADTGSQAEATGAEALADASTEPSTVRLNANAGDDDAPPPAANSRLRRATASDLAGIWEGSTVPIESIDASTRMLTPSVGRVRTILYGGEVFEGRLYAVGQGKVWLDTELGRLALVSDQVQKLEQLASPDGTPVLGQAGSEALAGLPRVRARTPGGMFYGKVTARDDKTVTLITDEGARITLDAPIIEPVPASRTVIVGSAPKQP